MGSLKNIVREQFPMQCLEQFPISRDTNRRKPSLLAISNAHREVEKRFRPTFTPLSAVRPRSVNTHREVKKGSDRLLRHSEL